MPGHRIFKYVLVKNSPNDIHPDFQIHSKDTFKTQRPSIEGRCHARLSHLAGQFDQLDFHLRSTNE
jgi:hypothetical protein